MALTETQIVKIGKILRVDPDLITLHLESGAVEITAVKQTAIEAEITAWDAGPGTVTEWAKLHPKEANKGVETDPDKDANTIRETIALYLGRTDWASAASAYEFEMVRG